LSEKVGAKPYLAQSIDLHAIRRNPDRFYVASRQCRSEGAGSQVGDKPLKSHDHTVATPERHRWNDTARIEGIVVIGD